MVNAPSVADFVEYVSLVNDQPLLVPLVPLHGVADKSCVIVTVDSESGEGSTDGIGEEVARFGILALRIGFAENQDRVLEFLPDKGQVEFDELRYIDPTRAPLREKPHETLAISRLHELLHQEREDFILELAPVFVAGGQFVRGGGQLSDVLP